MSLNNKFVKFTVTKLKTTHLSIHQCTATRFGTHLYSMGAYHGNLPSLFMSGVTCFILQAHMVNYYPKVMQLKSRERIWRRKKVNGLER